MEETSTTRYLDVRDKIPLLTKTLLNLASTFTSNFFGHRKKKRKKSSETPDISPLAGAVSMETLQHVARALHLSLLTKVHISHTSEAHLQHLTGPRKMVVSFHGGDHFIILARWAAKKSGSSTFQHHSCQLSQGHSAWHFEHHYYPPAGNLFQLDCTAKRCKRVKRARGRKQ